MLWIKLVPLAKPPAARLPYQFDWVVGPWAGTILTKQQPQHFMTRQQPYLCVLSNLVSWNTISTQRCKFRQKASKDNIYNFDWLIGGGAATILTARQVKRGETYQHMHKLFVYKCCSKTLDHVNITLLYWQDLINHIGWMGRKQIRACTTSTIYFK